MTKFQCSLNKMRLPRLAGAALCAVLANTALSQSKPPSLDPAPPIPVVDAASSVPAPLPPSRFDGDPGAIRVLLSAQIETVLSSEMFGKIDDLNVGLGEGVRAGEVLLTFQCDETKARLKMADAEAAAARETLRVKQRLRRLNAAGESEVNLAQFDLDRAKAAVEIAQAQLKSCTVQSPFDGHVVKILVKPYQTVNPGTPLFELISHGPIKMRMNVPSRLLKDMTIGSAFDVDILETGETYEAIVSRINSRIDAIAQTVEIEAVIDLPDHVLMPGMSGVARLKARP